MKDQPLPTLDEWLEQHRDDPIEWGDGPHLISVYELRAMGALDVPPEWRKSLGVPKSKREQRNLFSDLVDDEDEAIPAPSAEAPDDLDDEESEGNSP